MDSPLILSLDAHGVPHRWISWQQACFYYAKNLIAWTLGDKTFTYYGGICRATGERSSITAHSIIAIKGKALAAKGFNQVPPLNNRELFRRDRHMCAYCGGEFNYFRLTRDLDKRGHGVPALQRPQEEPPAAGMRHGAPLRALRAEQGGVPDPHQPPDTRRPDGVPQAARRVQFATGHRPCLISGVTRAFIS